MQTYIFTVAVTGDDVQDTANAARETVVTALDDLGVNADYHVTDTLRITT